MKHVGPWLKINIQYHKKKQTGITNKTLPISNIHPQVLLLSHPSLMSKHRKREISVAVIIYSENYLKIHSLPLKDL